jgi:DNA invertase Pin-like site-specific DNA recombinase
MMPIDAIYARQSVDKADSISIESQIEYCVYETHGQPYQTYCDKGYSGKNTDRPQFQIMLQDVKKGRIKRVICYKLDRCSRSILDFTRLMEIFQRYNVEFVSCTEKFDTSTPMGRAMLNICIVFAQLERETIQQRIFDAYHSRCKHGFFMGGRVPFGFQLVPYEINGKKSAAYSPVPHEIKILKRMYAIYSHPTTSLSDVVSDLARAGIANPKRNDGLWVRSHIGRMLKNPIYVKADEDIYRYFMNSGACICNGSELFIGHNGCYLYHKDNVSNLVLAPHEGIVSSEIWLRCRNKGLQAGGSTGQRKSISSWLCGKIKCNLCGYAAIVRTHKGHNGKVYRYLSCSKAYGKNKTCTGFRSLSVDLIEKMIEDQLLQQLQSINLKENREISKRNKDRVMRKSAVSMDVVTDVLSRWQKITLQKKKEIMDILVRCIRLSEDKIIIRWQI